MFINKEDYKERITIAVHYSYPLCEIKDIINGYNDYVIFYSIVDCKMHIAKINYNNKHAYFTFKNTRIGLDNCYKV